jgi:hypothetical protein
MPVMRQAFAIYGRVALSLKGRRCQMHFATVKKAFEYKDSERYHLWVLKKSLNRTPFHLRVCGCRFVLSTFD